MQSVIAVILVALATPIETQFASAVSASAVSATAVSASAGYMDVPRTLQAIASAYLASSVREDREYAGGILVDARGRFHHSVGRNRAGADRVTFSVPVPAGYRLVGFWHTHGAPGLLRDAFSTDDANLVRATALPLYLITPAGRLKVLKPKHVARRAAATRGRSLFRTKAYDGAPVVI